MPRFRSIHPLVSTLAVGAAVAGTPAIADACGGMFCDAPPPDGLPMPVDQTGENILFTIGGGFVEAHVQIEYAADDDTQRFAWIVPVPEVPEIEVGSARLLDNTLDATVPIYGFETQSSCADPDDGGAPQTSGIGFIEMPDGGGASGEEPTVAANGVVGAFEYVVLEGGTADTVMAWLADNDYAEDDEAPDILQEYLDEGHVFVAFRLDQSEGLDDLHPVVIRYPGTEPCIPLRLTRVAAQEDMDVRALVFGEARAFPVNYDHVQLNRVRLDWSNTGANYKELVTGAVDEAGGRAFVTEYAGDSELIANDNLDTSMLDADVFESLDAMDVVDALRDQGLLACSGECLPQHELILGLLTNYLPPPPGIAPEDFYACMECYRALVDVSQWDGVAFAADFRERIVDPMNRATELLTTWPYVTRLYTTISPHEMLSDPTFAEVEGLPDVAFRHGGLRDSGCCDTTMRLPGGREVILGTGNSWPVWGNAMPWAERISEYQPDGPPAELSDRSNEIDALLADYNAAAACPNPGGGGTTGGDGMGTDGGLSSTTGGTGGGDGTDGQSQGQDAGQDDVTSGCSCRSSGPSAGALMLFVLGLVSGRRRP